MTTELNLIRIKDLRVGNIININSLDWKVADMVDGLFVFKRVNRNNGLIEGTKPMTLGVNSKQFVEKIK